MMPSKSKKKSSKRTPPVISTEEKLPPAKTLDAYFPRTPMTQKNNVKLEISSETVYYYDGVGSKTVAEEKSKEDILSVGCLSTPEISPEKAEQAALDGHIAALSESDTAVVEESKGLMSSSSSHTSNSSDSSTLTNNSKPKRKGRATSAKSEAPKSQANHLLTDFFPVRKSSRKTAKELQREHDELMRNLILDECEDGLKVRNYEGKGRGVEATKPFAKGDFVVEYAGDLVELKEAKFREENYKKDVGYGCYMYFFNHRGKSYCIDATKESAKLGRLLNHSRSKPNCMTKTLDIGDRAHLILVAGRDINVGEELVYDYGDRSKEAIDNNPWLKD